jgi:hypothetical protein
MNAIYRKKSAFYHLVVFTSTECIVAVEDKVNEKGTL